MLEGILANDLDRTIVKKKKKLKIKKLKMNNISSLLENVKRKRLKVVK